jgi:hypothetical protein
VLSTQPASAAWNNVFQVCCKHCNKQKVQSVVAASPVCPQKQCTTRYHQRSYYEPVTSYRTSCRMEPVTTYRTSYYYEPVTSYRYSCVYDPCTCSYRQVCTPCTSYRLRSQCSPVTSYLQRCCLQPVTSYRQVNYWVPETTCCETTIGAPTYTPPAAAAIAQPSVGEESTVPSVPAVPGVSDSSDSTHIPPSVSERSDFNRFMPPANPNSLQQPRLGAPVPTQPEKAAPLPKVHPERIASRSATESERVALRSGQHNVLGRLVGLDRRPEARTEVMFVNEQHARTRALITTDQGGQFQTSLAAGTWLVYVPDNDGRPVFLQKIYVMDAETPQAILVSR